MPKRNMNAVTGTNFLLIIVIAVCSAASLTDEDIAKIFDDTAQEDRVANIGEYGNDLHLGNLRDKLRTLQSLSVENSDLFPVQDPSMLGDASTVSEDGDVYRSKESSHDTGSKSDDKSDDSVPAWMENRNGDASVNKRVHNGVGNWHPVSPDNFMSVFPENINFGSPHEGQLRNGLFSGTAYSKEKDQNTDDPLTKRGLFCNRRTGCGRKRGKREHQTVYKSDSLCHRIKCDSKRFLCNRGGCRAKRVENIVSNIYCGSFICPSSRETLNGIESTDFPRFNPVIDETKNGIQHALTGRNAIDNDLPETISNGNAKSFTSDPELKLSLLNLMRKSISQQINNEKLREFHSAMCKMYGVCANDRNDFYFK